MSAPGMLSVHYILRVNNADVDAGSFQVPTDGFLLQSLKDKIKEESPVWPEKIKSIFVYGPLEKKQLKEANLHMGSESQVNPDDTIEKLRAEVDGTPYFVFHVEEKQTPQPAAPPTPNPYAHASAPMTWVPAVPRRPTILRSNDLWNAYLSFSPTTEDRATDFLNVVKTADVVTKTFNFCPFQDAGHECGDSSLILPDYVHPEDGKISVYRFYFEKEDDALANGMAIVVLPVPIFVFNHDASPYPSVLIIRNEDVALIKLWSAPSSLRNVVKGNPGISKSWHLWKFFVFAANPYLWQAVACDWNVRPPEGSLGATHAFPNLPDVIAFNWGNGTTRLFFLSDGVVHSFKDTFILTGTAGIEQMARSNIRIHVLYEPLSCNGPPPNVTMLIPCTTAMSPRSFRFKEFLKEANTEALVLSTPTLTELVVFFSFIYRLEGLDKGEREKHLVMKVKRSFEVGPFIRVLLYKDHVYERYCHHSVAVLEALDEDQLRSILKSIDVEVALPHGGEVISHRFARYVTPKAYMGNFTYEELRPAAPFVVAKINRVLKARTTEELRVRVEGFRSKASVGTFDRKIFETLLVRYINEGGLQWKYCPAAITLLPDSEAGPCSLNCHKQVISYDEPSVDKMEPHVVYHPYDDRYPFVDILWVNERGGTVFAIQNTTGASHRVSIKSYWDLRRKLKMDTNHQLVVYMATLPENCGNYIWGTPSTFFSGVTEVSFSFPVDLQFRVLLPPGNMGNSEDISDMYSIFLQKISSKLEQLQPAPMQH